ncbi:MAG: glycosyltransferase family 39 protein [bacterium]|nr:glycosyltransferase family 39 protein [bacterium]
MLKKLNVGHLVVIIALPIVLALINPNWIFNANIVDDYAYLGYQLDYPKYIGWSPSSESYAIERLSVIFPGYVVRQVFSPLVANFVVHLGVYYLAIFSVYGILNRLFNAKVALITALLFGQYPLILRSVGWDYADGYAMAYFTLTIFFLTQGVGVSRRNLYLMGAGGAFILMLNAHFFNVFYFPAILVYYLLIHRWRSVVDTLITPVVFGGLGALIAFAPLALIYYGATGNILFTSSLGTSTDLRYFYYFLLGNFSKIHPHWHFIFVIPAIIVILRPNLWKRYTVIPADNPQYKNWRYNLRAILGLFVFAYGMLIGWRFWGFIFTNGFFYVTNIIMVVFLLIGALFADRITRYPQAQFRYLVAGAFFIPMIPLAVFSFTDQHLLITNYWILYGAAIACMLIALHPKRTLYGLFGFVMFAGAMLHDSYGARGWFYPPRIDVYVADRYMNQTMYEKTVEIVKIINRRYETVSYEDFRLFYDRDRDVNSRLFNSVASVYLWTADRVLIPNYIDESLIREFNEADDVIILSTVGNTEALVAKLHSVVDVTEVERHYIPHYRGDIELIIFSVNKDN